KTGLLLLALLPAAPRAALAWSQIGHNAVAAIAEANLTEKTRTAVEDCLGGHSIIYYAMWADNYRRAPEYRYTARWHAARVDEECRHVARDGGDVVTAVTQSAAALGNGQYKKLPADTVALHIKLLVHLVGDLHCPVHVDYPGEKNSFFNLRLNGYKTTYHTVWDNNVPNARKWSYTEWAQQLNRPARDGIAEITAGTPADWFRQTALDCRVIYDWARPGLNLERDEYTNFMNQAVPLAESQIKKAGYRLAKLLNDIFDP
ncbi:MAG: S1/P1 nuclease, partial [Opitutaceae bacterium]|nr:S1/P1 nuclease [Opitutaceae bacterium]